MGLFDFSVAVPVELPFPPFFFGLIMLVVLGLLGFVTFSYRDVYHRHELRSQKLEQRTDEHQQH